MFLGKYAVIVSMSKGHYSDKLESYKECSWNMLNARLSVLKIKVVSVSLTQWHSGGTANFSPSKVFKMKGKK